MKTVGIISEYNPFHLGHLGHIEKTMGLIGGECAIVSVMSGNFVERGDFSVFNKHARAEAAVRCGVDLVLELPSQYALSSAEGFARAGVHILDSLGVCEYISFGSESGDVAPLKAVADTLVTPEANALMKKCLERGLSYASARQKAADAILGAGSQVLSEPNNLLGIEYLIALSENGSSMRPLTVKRTGGAHDGESGYSASALRKMLLCGEEPWEFMPDQAAAVYKKEISEGRGPVSMKQCESAIMSRLRAFDNYAKLLGASEGLGNRFMKCAFTEPTLDGVLEKAKTKRYAMSRLRRMMVCACLNISETDAKKTPPYIRVLAMNGTGMRVLKDAQTKAKLPIITKPASVQRLDGRCAEVFNNESAATDFYVLAYPDENERRGGGEWRKSPLVVCSV